MNLGRFDKIQVVDLRMISVKTLKTIQPLN